MSHGSLSNSSYEGGMGMPTQKRNSQPNLGSGYYGQALPQMHPNMQRMVRYLCEFNYFCLVSTPSHLFDISNTRMIVMIQTVTSVATLMKMI